MRRYRYLLLTILLLILIAIPLYAQENNRPLVIFITDRSLGSGSNFDNSATGLSRLGSIFNELGAEVLIGNLDQNLPSNAQVAVLIQPKRELTFMEVVRLWIHLSRGNHLLVALDPSGYNRITTEPANSTLLSLLTSDYGIEFLDGLLAEPWATDASIEQLSGTLLQTQANAILHPVVQPLYEYSLPIYAWGARPLLIEPFGVNYIALSLANNRSAYAETNRDFFRGRASLGFNSGEDLQGQLNIGGFAINRTVGGRLAAFGDAEIFQNDFGLARDPNTGAPRYPGNQVMAERIAAWLLDAPLETWPSFPANFTWIAIDGNAEDWPAQDNPPSTVNGPIKQIRAVYDDAYLYILVETAQSPDAAMQLDLEFTLNDSTSLSIQAQNNLVRLAGQAISDAQVKIADAIELRLPLRITGVPPLITDVCLSQNTTTSSQPLDCWQQPLTPEAITTFSPADLAQDGVLPIVRISTLSNSAVVRSGPGTQYEKIASFTDGHFLYAVGRNEGTSWIQVENAGYKGWVAEFLLARNFDFDQLPVIETIPQK